MLKQKLKKIDFGLLNVATRQHPANRELLGV